MGDKTRIFCVHVFNKLKTQNIFYHSMTNLEHTGGLDFAAHLAPPHFFAFYFFHLSLDSSNPILALNLFLPSLLSIIIAIQSSTLAKFCLEKISIFCPFAL